MVAVTNNEIKAELNALTVQLAGYTAGTDQKLETMKIDVIEIKHTLKELSVCMNDTKQRVVALETSWEDGHHRVNEAYRISQDNRISLAKMAAVGGGGGVVTIALFEIIKLLLAN